MNSDSSSAAAVRRLRDRQRESTAQEILSAAEQEILQHGIHAIHMAEIAARAGVAVGTLYNHYKDRDALVSALAELRRSELLDCIDLCVERVDGQPFRAQLREFLSEVFTKFEAHWQFFACFTQAESAPPNISQSAQSFQREMYQRIETLVERGRKQRVLRAKVVPLAPALLMGLTRAMLMRRSYSPNDGSPLPHVDTLIDFFLKGAGGKRA
jgi:AcrR family transcriptional regulator